MAASSEETATTFESVIARLVLNEFGVFCQ